MCITNIYQLYLMFIDGIIFDENELNKFNYVITYSLDIVEQWSVEDVLD